MIFRPHNEPEPIYAQLGEPLGDEQAAELVKRQRTFSSAARKAAMWAKYRVYREDVLDLVEAAIDRRQNDPSTREEMKKFAATERNDALDITRDAAVVWKHGPTRTIADAKGEEQDALAQLVRESSIDTIAPIINHLGFLQGPQIAIPMVRGGVLNVDHLPSHLPDIALNIDDPTGEPAAVAYPTAYDDLYMHNAPSRVVLVDPVFVRTYTFKGDRPEEIVERRVRHDAMFCPVATFRSRPTILGDEWWDALTNQRLIDGTIKILLVLTVLDYVRKTQNKHLLSMTGNLEGVPEGQTLDPEHPLYGRARSPDQVAFDTLNFNTDPLFFIRHALFLAHCLAEPFGGRVDVASGQPAEYAKIVIPDEAQTELRNAQLPMAQLFERHFWAAASAMMRAYGHPLAGKLPDPAGMEERLRVDFGLLARTIADPRADSDRRNWELQKGQTSQFRLMQERLGPGVTKTEARQRVLENLDEQAEFNDLVTKRNLGMSQDGSVITASQAFGAQGTPAREANRGAAPEGEPAQTTAPDPEG
jgi:hypothetical protein